MSDNPGKTGDYNFGGKRKKLFLLWEISHPGPPDDEIRPDGDHVGGGLAWAGVGDGREGEAWCGRACAIDGR